MFRSHCSYVSPAANPQDSNELWSTFASGVDGRLRIEKSTTSLAGWVATKNEMVNIPDVAQVGGAIYIYIYLPEL